MTFEEKLKQYILEKGIDAEMLVFQQSCHSVEDAAKSANAKKEDFIKNICLSGESGKIIVAIVKGEDKVDFKKIEAVSNAAKIRTLKPQEILEKIGYPCGGVPSFGYSAIFLVDSKVLANEFVYSGGGSENSLIKITPKELLKANSGKIVNISKD